MIGTCDIINLDNWLRVQTKLQTTWIRCSKKNLWISYKDYITSEIGDFLSQRKPALNGHMYTITNIRQNNHVWHSSGRKEERQTTEVTRRGWVYHLPTPSDCLSSERRHQWCPDGLDDYRIGHHHHHRYYHYWAVVVFRGWASWARASACHLLSCAVLCQIVSLKYLSRSFLHRLLSFLVIWSPSGDARGPSVVFQAVDIFPHCWLCVWLSLTQMFGRSVLVCDVERTSFHFDLCG